MDSSVVTYTDYNSATQSRRNNSNIKENKEKEK